MKNAIGLILLVCLYLVPCKAQKSDWEKVADLTPTMLSRAAEFKKAVKTDGSYKSAVYVYEHRSITYYLDAPEKLAARLKTAGFTDVFLSCYKALQGDANLLKWQKSFIAKAHQYGMQVYALRLSSPSLFVDDEKIYRECKLVLDYNASVKKEERFDGVSADLEPHTMKEKSTQRPGKLKLIWSKQNFGMGKDNDLLLKRTIEVMKIAQKELAPLKFNEAISAFFQPKVNEGLLKYGGTDEFLQYCDEVIAMTYNSKMTRIWEMAEPLLIGAKDKPQSVGICVKTSLGTTGDDDAPTSLQPQGWDSMIETINFLMKKGAEYKTFKGVDVFEFQGFEIMWKGV